MAASSTGCWFALRGSWRASPRGDLRVIREGQRGHVGHVVRADLARFMVDCTDDNTYLREAVVVGS